MDRSAARDGGAVARGVAALPASKRQERPPHPRNIRTARYRLVDPPALRRRPLARRSDARNRPGSGARGSPVGSFCSPDRPTRHFSMRTLRASLPGWIDSPFIAIPGGERLAPQAPDDPERGLAFAGGKRAMLALPMVERARPGAIDERIAA